MNHNSNKSGRTDSPLMESAGHTALIAARVLYVLIALSISIYYLAVKEPVSAFLGPVSLLFLCIPSAAKLFLKIRLGNYFETFLLFFCSFAFQFGVALHFYDKFNFHDIAAHFISGIFFLYAGMCLYAKWSSDFKDRYSALLFQLCFSLFFSMAIAVFWEIGEFLAYLITEHDMQHHLDTGVFDTMEDIISCLFGSIFAGIDFFICFRKNKKTPLGQMLLQFDDLN